MNKSLKTGLVLLILLMTASCTQFKYETVENDLTNTRIYTLDNGLKVYMSVNNDAPRVEAHIAVRVGGKNDPHETTGLAHYFEHLMFKGTEEFGTQNYALEKPMLDEIESLFEVYRKTVDEAERKVIYHRIDSISYEASKISIPNEYDKLMAAIGAKGTNAYTSYDQTVYTENFPSNEIENWAKIQSDRFAHNVIRGFHTELETVYEEKNMSLTDDTEKAFDEMFAALFKNHPYGTQTILGTQQNLKNPSITNIKNYYKEWYVPNNMAICISGDINPDETIKIINKYFKNLTPNPDLKKLSFEKEEPIVAPVVKDVYGLESPKMLIAWRFPGAKDKDMPKLTLLSQILSNGTAGLVDLDINQQQKTLSSYGGVYGLSDYSIFIMMGEPKKGQTLDQVRDLLLAEVDKVKKGEFDESLMKAVVNNYKRRTIQTNESIRGMVNNYVQCFVDDVPWKEFVENYNLLSSITKEDIVAFANEYLGDNYAYIRKLEGKDKNEIKMSKPEITPIFTNRDTSSQFLRDIQASKAAPIEPLFVDFQKDMTILSGKSDIQVLYKQNVTNDLFSLSYVFEMGSNEDKLLPLAAMYLDYLGTDTMTPEQVKQAFYALACNYYISVGNDRTFVQLSGLGENMNESIALFESLLANAKSNPATFKDAKANLLQSRAYDKLSQNANFSQLQQYAFYGPKSPSTNIYSNDELKALPESKVIDDIHSLLSKEHIVMYYGPQNQEDFLATLNQVHKVPETLTKVAENDSFNYRLTKDNEVFIAPYDAKQIYMIAVSNQGEKYDVNNTPIISLYNEYFGGGMNGIVFQEMREARGLAYSAQARLNSPSKDSDPYIFYDFIATQNDKMIDAITAFDEIINDMPSSQNAFDIAKESLITNIRTARTTKARVFSAYLRAKDLGLDYDVNKLVFDKVQGYGLQDVIDFQQKWVKGRKYSICILGDAKDLDMKSLEKYGKITYLKTSEIFGY